MARPMMRWDPLAQMRELDEFFERVRSGLMSSVTPRTGGMTEVFTPVEVLTRGDDLVVRAEIPGIDPERDLDITVENGLLCIRGERRAEQREEGEQYLRIERRYGSFERLIALPESVRTDDIEAEYRDGILEVRVAGAARTEESRRIPVRAGAGKSGAIEASSAPASKRAAGRSKQSERDERRSMEAMHGDEGGAADATKQRSGRRTTSGGKRRSR